MLKTLIFGANGNYRQKSAQLVAQALADIADAVGRAEIFLQQGSTRRYVAFMPWPGKPFYGYASGSILENDQEYQPNNKPDGLVVFLYDIEALDYVVGILQKTGWDLVGVEDSSNEVFCQPYQPNFIGPPPL